VTFRSWPAGSFGLALALAASLCGALALGAEAPRQLAGRVLDSTGYPLAGVTVDVAGAAARQATTAADGSFSLDGLPDGEYELLASLAGFAPSSARVRLEDGTAEPVVFRLRVLAFDTLVVTATKTGERDPRATPLAVSVLSGAELQRARARTVEDLAGLAPSLNFSQNTGFAQLTIRGIGTNVVFAGSDPSSAVYLDGVYLARPAMVLADFLDLDRVEVLRGPQGTLYGRNAVGGAVNLVTRPPADTFEGEAGLAAGNLGALRAEAQARGPLVPGKLRGSAALLRGYEDGYVRDLDHPDHPLGGEDVTAGRAKLLFLPGARSELMLSGDVTFRDPAPLTYSKVLQVKPGFEVDNPPGPRDVRTSTLASSRNLQWGAAARYTLRLAPDTTLASLTAFRALDYELVSDTDVTELELTVAQIHERQHQWSEELTLAQERPGRSFVLGVFLLDELDAQPTTVRLGGPGLDNHLDPSVEARSGAAFAQGSLGLTRRLAATLGLRYTREHKTIDNDGSLSAEGQPAALVAGSAYSYSDQIAHDAWTPKLGLEWKPGERVLGYASATRGFKSGGFNISSREPGRGYSPEWAWSFEAGLKATLASGRASFDLAAFHTDYTDLQVQFTIRPGVIDISNAAAASISGFEAEGSWQPARSLRAGGHLAWLDARYDRYTAVGPGGATRDVAGNRLSNAPEWSGRLWLEWSARAGRLGALRLRAEARGRSTAFFTAFNDEVERQLPYGLLDASAELARPHWSLAAYGRNLTDEAYITGSFSSPPPAIGGRPGPSREWGLRVSVRR
jgi:iron complex outermembrane recepter protein